MKQLLCWRPHPDPTEEHATDPICSINKQKTVWKKKSCLKTIIMEREPRKTKAFSFIYFFPTQRPLGEICRKTKSDKLENNSEIKVCLMRRRTGGRMRGKTKSDLPCRFMFCPGKTRGVPAICPSHAINRSHQKRSPQAWK